ERVTTPTDASELCEETGAIDDREFSERPHLLLIEQSLGLLFGQVREHRAPERGGIGRQAAPDEETQGEQIVAQQPRDVDDVDAVEQSHVYRLAGGVVQPAQMGEREVGELVTAESGTRKAHRFHAGT